MTPAELRALADDATPGPSLVLAKLDGGVAVAPRAADVRLANLAPDLARLCAEMGETLEAVMQIGLGLRQGSLESMRALASPALTKLSELKPVT